MNKILLRDNFICENGYGNNTKIQFDNFLQLSEGSETIEIAANKLKKSRVEFSKFEMGGPK